MKRLLTTVLPDDVTLALYEKPLNHPHLCEYLIHGDNFSIAGDTFMFGTHLDPFTMDVKDREYAVSIYHSILTKLTTRLIG